MHPRPHHPSYPFLRSCSTIRAIFCHNTPIDAGKLGLQVIVLMYRIAYPKLAPLLYWFSFGIHLC